MELESRGLPADVEMGDAAGWEQYPLTRFEVLDKGAYKQTQKTQGVIILHHPTPDPLPGGRVWSRKAVELVLSVANLSF